MSPNRRSLLVVNVLLLVAIIFAAGIATPAQSKKDKEKAERLAVQGNQAYEKKDYKLAIIRYSEALKFIPVSPSLHFWKGKAHYNLKEYQPAHAELTMALSQGYDAGAVYQLRYYVNYLLEQYDDALYDAGEAVKLDSTKTFVRTPLYNFVLGDIYRGKQQFALSNQYYRAGAAGDPKDQNIYYWISLNHKDLGEPTEAGIACVEALKRNTTYVTECSLLAADMYYAAQKYDEAAELYEKVLTGKPDSYDVYVTLADLYRNENRFDLAIMTLRRASKQYPNDGAFLSNLAWNFSLADRPQESVDAATKAIALAPQEPAAYTNRCRAYIELKDYAQATISCNDALRLSPGDGETMLYLGRIYESQKQAAKATDAFRKAVDGLLKFTKQNPNYSDGFYLLGNAYFKLSRFNEAIDSYRKCLAISPKFARGRLALGISYLEKGDRASRQAAIEQYNLLLSIDPPTAEKLKSQIDQ